MHCPKVQAIIMSRSPDVFKRASLQKTQRALSLCCPVQREAKADLRLKKGIYSFFQDLHSTVEALTAAPIFARRVLQVLAQPGLQLRYLLLQPLHSLAHAGGAALTCPRLQQPMHIAIVQSASTMQRQSGPLLLCMLQTLLIWCLILPLTEGCCSAQARVIRCRHQEDSPSPGTR